MKRYRYLCICKANKPDCQYACLCRIASASFPLWRVPKFCCLKRLGTCECQCVRKVIV